MEFTDFHNWVYKHFNVNLNAYKPEQLNRRINSLMSRIGVKNLEEYKSFFFRGRRKRDFRFYNYKCNRVFRNPELFKELENLKNIFTIK